MTGKIIKIRYKVFYGDHGSFYNAPSWTEACRFMKQLIDDGYKIASVQKVQS